MKLIQVGIYICYTFCKEQFFRDGTIVVITTLCPVQEVVGCHPALLHMALRQFIPAGKVELCTVCFGEITQL